MSASPPWMAILPASVEASSVASMSSLASVSRPNALATASSHPSVPVFCSAMRSFSPCAGPARRNARLRSDFDHCANHVVSPWDAEPGNRSAQITIGRSG